MCKNIGVLAHTVCDYTVFCIYDLTWLTFERELPFKLLIKLDTEWFLLDLQVDQDFFESTEEKSVQ